jgi:hypothetical protein
MRTRFAKVFLAASLCSPAIVFGQATSAPASAPTGPAPGANQPQVGSVAPDFSLPGATRYGRLQNPVKLSDFRGQTVVLAFFYQARTKG